MTDRTEFDLVSELLETSHLRATVYANPRACGAWQFVGPSAGAAFHLVARGACWLHGEDQAPQPLTAGDLVVLLRGKPHALTAGPALDGMLTRLPPRTSEDEPVTELVCGRFDFGAHLAGEVLDDLPDRLIVRNDSAWLEGLARLLAVEAASTAPGRQVALDRLSDVLFIAVLRHVMKRGGTARGLLAALADSRLSRALAAMHREPAERWTLETLAREAGMSRTVFAQRFRHVMGTTPLKWLTRLRMDRAQAWIEQEGRPVGSVAIAVGYASEAAFRRAYGRWKKAG